MTPQGAFAAESTERFGVAPQVSTVAADGDLLATTTPTLVVDHFVPGVEIVVADADGNGVGGSGPLHVDRWTVPEGLLNPGGHYRWHVLRPTGGTIAGMSQPAIDGNLDELTVDGEMVVGSQSVDYVVHQDGRDLFVETGLGPQVAASGLRTSFFPHYDSSNEVPLDEDGEPVDELPPAVLPGPGAETVSETSEWTLRDIHLWGCPKEERADKPWGGGPLVFHTIEAILCEVRYEIEAEATITEDGGHAAAHNVVGTNVPPSYGTTINGDLAIDDGFVVSTGGQQVISSSFPLQTDFGFRSLGYLEVPETGVYRFGTQSPGGAELAVYDTTEHDLGRTVVSADGAWWPTTLDEEYQAMTHPWNFKNEYVRSDTRDCGTQVCRTSYYAHEDDDPTWYQVERRDARWLLDDLRASGPPGDVVRWGHEMELEAGRQYPLAFTGWVGALGGDIGIHVDGPGQAPQPLPFEWISAAGDDVVGFDRGFDTADTAAIGGVDAAVSGHGDGLAVLGANGALDFYDTDGGIGWTPSGSVPDVALRPPPVMHPASAGTGVAFDDAGSTVAVVVDQWPDADRDDFEPVHHTADLVLGLEDLFGAPPGEGSGPFTVYSDGAIVVLEEPFWVDVMLLRRPTWPTVRLEVDELVAYVDEAGEIIDGSIAGFVHDGDESWPLSELVSGRIDDDELMIDEISSHLPGSGHRTYGFQLTFLESTPLPSDDLPDSLDIAIVDRVDVNAPWSEGNARVSFLNDILGGRPDPELVPDRDVYQSVDVSPDGNTIVVSQPAGDHQRVVVVGRDHRGAAWGIIGMFATDSGPAALGVDGEERRVAFVDDGQVVLHTWTPGAGWSGPEALAAVGAVDAMALDYFGQHLAIGESAPGTVTVLQRSPFDGTWSEQRRLDGPGTFGHDVVYSWGLLTVTDANGLVRVYRDTGFQPWSNYGDWSQVQAAGDGRLVASAGGNSLRVRLVETRAWSPAGFDALTTHVG